jgi:hypothetical protein
MEAMSRFAHDLAIGRSNRYHRIGFRVVVDADGQMTIAMHDGDGLLQTRLSPGEAMNLAAILQTASRVADP